LRDCAAELHFRYANISIRSHYIKKIAYFAHSDFWGNIRY
jgi:hypothetical protein